MSISFQPSICGELLQFQEMLKKMRSIDDKIIYELNQAKPTESFSQEVDSASKCQFLHQKLQSSYTERDNAIKHCIAVTEKRLNDLKSQTDQNSNPDSALLKALRECRFSLRQLHTELNIEEVVRETSLKGFNHACDNPDDDDVAGLLSDSRW
uniref:Protein MIX23 n=1 Tax=Romanomermis culicivorax TaxID=13658 RepID=A0A915I1Y0_ROMCU